MTEQLSAEHTVSEAPPRSSSLYLFIGVYSAVLYTVLLVAPVIAGPVIVKFELDPAQLGLLFSLELGAFSLASVPAYLWLTRLPVRGAVVVFTVIVAAGHVMSGIVDDFGALLVVRVVTSLAAGSITVVLLSLGPKTKNPGRAFGIFVVAQLAMGALILALFPVLYADGDVSAIYWTLAGLTLLTLPFVPLLKGVTFGRDGRATGIKLPPGKIVPFVAGLVAILLFYVALSGVWTFMGAIATDAGNDLGRVSLVLSIATVAGIVSALLATLLGDSPYRGLFLVLGFAAMIASVLLLLGAAATVVFVISAILFKFAWTFVLPYLLSGVAGLGGGAQTMNTTNLMIGGGFSLGPIIAGRTIEATGGYSTMLWIAAICLTVALVGAILLSEGKLIKRQ